MASAISLEYLKSIQGTPNGIPNLNENCKIPISQLPPEVNCVFKGQFADEEELKIKYPTAKIADYAFIDETTSFWYWNAGLTVPAWVNQKIEEAEYLNLSEIERSIVPYIIIKSMP